MLLEALTIKIGGSVVKSLVGLWLSDSPLGGPAADLTDALSSKVQGFTERRRLPRELDRIAERLAAKLEPFFVHDFRDVDDSEKLAAIDAVSDTLAAANFNTAIAVSLELDPQQIEKYLRDGDPERVRIAGLSEPATALYSFTLREASNYLAQFAAALPDFNSAATRELLKREGALSQQLSRALDRLPPPIAPREWGPGGEDDRFESQYLRWMQRNFDKLELFGLDTADTPRMYNLSVAYISLSLTQPADSNAAKGGAAATDEVDVVRAEKALIGTNRLLLRGWAGSGKTTLMQWLAVSASRSDFPDSLVDWNGKVPFLLQLRRWVHESWPSPENFLSHTAPLIVGAMPQGYVHRILAAGRGLILVDGVDEVPEGDRSAARLWLEELMDTFPENVYIVTSRPPALDQEWTSMPNFLASDIQPMEMADIRSFVTHWHEATLGPEPSSSLRAEVEGLRDKLQRRIRDVPTLRSLATSPLLCAMICALHRSRRSRLPENRMELYRVAIEVLLTRRDPEREVTDAAVGELIQGEQEALLQQLALWLLQNGMSDIDRSTAVTIIDQVKPRLGNVVATSEELYKYLLTRSGLLREPTVNRIDFLHRTFMEYFAAKALMLREELGQLISHAHLDQWREVVILACGHASERQRSTLIRGLLDRADAEQAQSHRLQLLAVSCLETATELDPAIRSELDQRLSTLLPPANLTDAVALASAGDLAVKHLTFEHRRVAEQAACVRTLVRIGSAEAFAALTGYAKETRVMVVRELIKGLGYYDPASYSAQVLGVSGLDRGNLVVRDANIVPHLSNLRGLQTLTARLSGRLTSLEAFRSLHPCLVSLDISDCTSVSSISPISHHTGLVSLNISATKVASLRPLEEMTSLQYLRANDTNIVSLVGLKSGRLRSLQIDSTGVDNLEPIRDLTADLRQLWLDYTSIRSIEPLRGAAQLSELTLTGSTVEDLSPLGECPELGTLWCDVAAPETLSTLPPSDSLIALRAAGTIPDSVSIPNLMELAIDGPRSLNFLKVLPSLRHLMVQEAPPERISLKVFEGLQYLEVVSLQGSFTDFEMLAELPRVRSITIHDIEPLQASVTKFLEARGFTGFSAPGITRYMRPIGSPTPVRSLGRAFASQPYRMLVPFSPTSIDSPR